MDFFGISWGAAHNVVWLPLIVGGFILLYYRFSRIKKALGALAGTHIAALLKNVSFKKQALKIILSSVGLLFLLLALLRPQWHKAEETIQQEGRELFIALDISRSMLAADCTPNRLVCAKQKITQLLKKLDCARVGLILFSGSAFVQCPLTSDYSAFHMYLEAVDAEMISSGTTAIDQAIKQSLTAFASMPERNNKLLILFTDGEDFSHNLRSIKQEAAQAGLSIFTFGIGTPEGAPVPLFDVHGKQIGHQKDAKGDVVISRLNEGILHTLAQDAGGTYLRMTDSDNDLNILVSKVNAFEKEHLEDRTYARMEEQYSYFLLVSFFCFALDWLL